jgi:UDP-N-acetylglucosamine 2-epimerase (non-hydrolysing)
MQAREEAADPGRFPRLARDTRPPAGPGRWKVLTLFGTRPEVIKLAPVIRALEASPAFHTVNVSSGQHTDLLDPLLDLFAVRRDFDLRAMRPGQSLVRLAGGVLAALAPVLEEERPDLVVVQGDTVTALAGALAGFFHRVPVAHVEAGLRSGDPASPFPEEMSRRLITRLATWHFAATAGNVAALLAEGVEPGRVFLTGNPVVDSLREVRERAAASPAVRDLLRGTEGLRRVVLTTHRRESFGEVLAGNLAELRAFVERHPDLALLFPVHPNPAVRGPAAALLAGHDRIRLLKPLGYTEFIGLLDSAWLLVSDSGGIQEEAPSLGKPLLVLRENTERPEAVEAGVARLVGGSPGRLRDLLEEAYRDDGWAAFVGQTANPFGRGDSGPRIVRALAGALSAAAPRRAAA